MLGASSSRSSSFGVVVYWDFQNAWIPRDYDLTTLKQNVEAALQTYNSKYFIEGNLNAVGPASGWRYEMIRRVPDITVVATPAANMECDVEQCSNTHGDNQVQTMRKTDVVDKHMIMDMFMTAIDNINSKILVIAGDVDDFLSSIEGLIGRSVIVMVALPGNSNRVLLRKPKAIWLWKSENANDDTMIKGGRPIVTNE